MSHARAAAAAAVVLFVIVGSKAQAQAPLAPVYAGGFLQETQPRTSLEQFRRALAITLAPQGSNLRLRVSLGLTCSGGSRRFTSDDLRFDVGLNPDGSFSHELTKRSFELGTAKVTISGSITPVSASGTFAVSARKGRDRCRSGARPFTAQPVDGNAPLIPGGAPAPGALLVGLSSQSTPVPYAAVARVSRDGTRIIQVFGTMVATCRASGRLAQQSRYQPDLQDSWIRLVLRDGRAKKTYREREGAAERRRGIRFSESSSLSLEVSAAGLLAQRSHTSSYRQPGYSERCTAARHSLRLVPIS